MTTSGIQPAAFPLVTQCLIQLRHRLPSAMFTGMTKHFGEE
jgi:hypothetical protein